LRTFRLGKKPAFPNAKRIPEYRVQNVQARSEDSLERTSKFDIPFFDTRHSDQDLFTPNLDAVAVKSDT